jgi:hypothetical protein
MWECIRCKESIPTKLVEPGIDDFGIYFICPVCRRRNVLNSLGSDRLGFLLLAQEYPHDSANNPS